MNTLTKKTSPEVSYGLHWFRRDLRVTGNPALEWSRKQHQGRVVGIFVFDPVFLARPDLSVSRFSFFLETLEVLRADLCAQGGDLLVLDQGPDEAFTALLQALRKEKLPTPATLSLNRDYEPFSRDRDARIEELLSRELGVSVHSQRDHLLIEPRELSKDGAPGSFYQVFSPFQKRWLKLFEEDAIRERVQAQRRALASRGSATRFNLSWKMIFEARSSLLERFEDRLQKYRETTAKKVTIPLPEAGHQAAMKLLQGFENEALAKYGHDRDIPSVRGTSSMSIYLKNGSITVPQILATLKLDTATGLSEDQQKYRSELIWREFYYHILFHRPQVENGAFLEKYRNIAWENREDYFQAWCEGRTGFPLVDAAMRQLNQTGWMHNRLRMVVASFLTKDLLINWQWGERYFMKHLLDGDLAPNNGGWQWAASTGCDPQPYFRIFNPVLQSKRFDPDGEFIRRFVPELRALSAPFIHEPWKSKSRIIGYPTPIVDHATQSRRAIALFTDARS